jgi:hypothetical protein
VSDVVFQSKRKNDIVVFEGKKRFSIQVNWSRQAIAGRRRGRAARGRAVRVGSTPSNRTCLGGEG